MVLNVEHVLIKVKDVDINGVSVVASIAAGHALRAVEAFSGGAAAAAVAPTHVRVGGKATIPCECLLFLLFFVGGAVEAGVRLLVLLRCQCLVLSSVKGKVRPQFG